MPAMGEGYTERCSETSEAGGLAGLEGQHCDHRRGEDKSILQTGCNLLFLFLLYFFSR